ncbi:alpha/beta hydrolase-fold protein [Sporolactobacillus shoreicorticis]|uniref:Alpha/beta hydrolase n=1 Tax=Sporolactobacillus shoreicorticis TaxID=1923877 RepID=A0ABW5S0W3_9BACL|nr:alpha/beta hydrolase-fold protein [Sporolactobacillus shoreicorticis]MCO7124678.1 alpha/beta hydrolase-fold protein [Sporolactobacillus shoreicorticis]
MTVVSGTYFSKILNRKKHFTAVLPNEPKDTDRGSLTLLHGVQGDDTDWICHVDLESLSDQYGIAFLCPSAENSFYTDHANGDQFGEALGVEFYDKVHDLFSLTRTRAVNGIAGLSMGGYGALRLGFKYHNQFSYIGAFSPALIFYKRHRNDPVFKKVFSLGLEGTENDVNMLFDRLTDDERPEIRLACGDRDPLNHYTQELYHFLKERHADVQYVQNDGFHDFTLWKQDLIRFLKQHFEKEQEEL